LIAVDEARHEKAYKLFMGQVFAMDPVRAVSAFAKMMKTKIVMPAILMDDGKDPNLYSKFSLVAQKLRVYTAADYAEIIGALVNDWKIAGLAGLSGASAKAQEYLCTLSERYHKLAERVKIPAVEHFSWIYDRDVVPASTE
jgi:acyl-[acyl-carrier-protein] desaturase